jgi:hypothetical protein
MRHLSTASPNVKSTGFATIEAMARRCLQEADGDPKKAAGLARHYAVGATAQQKVITAIASTLTDQQRRS